MLRVYLLPKAASYSWRCVFLGPVRFRFTNYVEPRKLLHLLFGTLMEWNRREAHDCSELFWQPRFLSRGSQNRHVTLPILRDWEWRRHILCIQCTLYTALFWRVNRYIDIYILYMLFIYVILALEYPLIISIFLRGVQTWFAKLKFSVLRLVMI
jgi:hypothetical protein